MTRVDFYLLAANDDRTPVSIACQLCDKAIHQDQNVYVFAPDVDLAEALDAALWAFRAGRFIAHERYTGTDSSDVSPDVFIGDDAPPPSHHTIMINLAAETPAFFSQFERVLEIVPGEAVGREAARTRFRFYKDRGYALQTHPLDRPRSSPHGV
ncbi:MAG TPA: DNA polymerase III subunit chi [Nevskiaceae bacterium]|nr:DNA polymerase III subunit chi [Nevskiaceae bacterium]